MLEKLKKFILSITKKEEGNSKNKIENLVVFLVILIITIIAINFIWNDEEENKKEVISDTNLNINNIEGLQTEDIQTDSFASDELEIKLKNILSKINGVSNVDVLITYSETKQVIAMYNENIVENISEEADTNGGTRTTKQIDTSKDVIYKEDGSSKVPITQKVVMPKIEGAIIIAKGVGDAIVKTNIIQAVEAATGLATHKIQVLEGNS